ncbi:uncharacterized protein [Dermacentor andersoni]|uniref:uncharacterized protein n=1 Tax=Dermacentor andersoni TaxID=34620 RepID=UPI0024173DAC|nr:uncharacterized protein LOC129382362 [Dermacentor andersoni]
MCSITMLVLIVASITTLCFGEDGSSSGPVDALRAAELMPNVVLAVGSVNIPLLRCLTADCTFLDKASGKVTFTWHVKSPDSSERTDIRVNFLVTGGGPDMCVAHINDDTSHSIPAQVVYSDYENCVVLKMFIGQREVCLLWEAKGTENTVPKNCLDGYKKSCGDGVTLYSDDTCNTY